jgi:hypothetical protein
VRCTCAAHDYGKNIDFGTWVVSANGIGDGGVFMANRLCSVGEVVVRAVRPFPYLNNLNRQVSSSAVCVSNVSRIEKHDEVGFVCWGSNREGDYLGMEDGMA